MNSNYLASSSILTLTDNGIPENMLPPFNNPFRIQQPQGMQWNFPMPQNMHALLAAAGQIQNGQLSQPRYMFGVPLMQNNQNLFTKEGYNALLGPVLLGNGVYVNTMPVGCSAEDDPQLAQALYDSTRNGQTYKQAIEGLHGVNHHPAHAWKDHAIRIDILVSYLADSVTKTVKKPF